MEAVKLETTEVAVAGPEALLVADPANPYPVDARRLWQWLGVATRFDKWIKDRIERFRFKEISDFRPFLDISTQSTRPATEYHLTLRMAQHLCMVEWTEKGEAARDYFCSCEEQVRSRDTSAVGRQLVNLTLLKTEHEVSTVILDSHIKAAKLLGSPDSLARAIGVQAVSRMLPTVDFKPHLIGNVSDIQEKLMTPTDIGAGLGLSAKAVNQLLAAKMYQVKTDAGWQLTEPGKVHGVYLDTGKRHSNGTPIQQIKWRSSISKLLQE